MKILILIVLSVLSGVLYRIGGAGTDVWPWANTKFRDFGVPLCFIASTLLVFTFHWSVFLSAVLLFGSLTTYWKKKGTDAQWYNWMFCGLGFSIAMLPYFYFTGKIDKWFLYLFLCTSLVTIWSEKTYKDWLEEFGRGAIIILTMLVYLIGG